MLSRVFGLAGLGGPRSRLLLATYKLLQNTFIDAVKMVLGGGTGMYVRAGNI